MAQPFIKWPGGKRWAAPLIARIVRDNLRGTYIEPFLGSGAVFFRLNPKRALLTDINADLINTYNCVKEDPAKLLRLLKAMPVSEENYYKYRISNPRTPWNKAARFLYLNRNLRLNSSVNIHDRLVKSPHFAHNKFVVFCDPQGKPESLWTGSTNWTVTGLCTQVNNGILIRSPALAAAYRQRWEDLKDAGATYPATLATAASTHAAVSVGGVAVTAWNAPVDNFVDLDDARALIEAAEESVVFLMFNPGPQETLLNAILALDPQKLFIHGVVNQDPGGGKKPLIKMTHQGQQLPPATIDAILPASLTEKSGWFDKEFEYNRVMIHSKVVVIDPFGAKPVVMTGSHNLGPKASSKNDDNLVIIKGAKGLAEEYAVNIMGVYGHYKWLYDQARRKGQPHFDGNEPDDGWQQHFTNGPAAHEIAFWLS